MASSSWSSSSSLSDSATGSGSGSGSWSSSFSFSSSSSSVDFSSSSSSSSVFPSLSPSPSPSSSSSSPLLILYGVGCLLLVLLFTWRLVRYFARPECPRLAKALTGLAWLVTFSICFLVPIALYKDGTDTLKKIWSFQYWCSFLLMWVILPFFSGYYDNGSGAFTVKGKIWESIKFNAKLYGAALLILAGLMIYLTAAEDMNTDNVLLLLMRVSNAWGLVMLILLLGYGLVEVPRHLHYVSVYEDRLRHLQYQAVSIHMEQDDTTDELQATLKILKDMKPKVEATHNDQFVIWYRCIESVVHDRRMALETSGRVGHPVDSDVIRKLAAVDMVTQQTLTSVHYECQVLVRHLNLVETQWRDLVDEALQLQENIQAQVSPPPRPSGVVPGLVWSYRVHYRRRVHRVIVIVLVLLSLFMFISEALLLSPVTPMSLILGTGIETQNFIVIQLLSIGPMIYMSWCAYYAVFRVRLAKLFHIGAHRTDECTLLLHATILLRVSSPLAFNFTKMLKLQPDQIEFLIGPDTKIPFINGSDFSDIFPLFLVGVSLLTFFNLLSRLFSCLRITRYARGQHTQDEETDMTCEEGKQLINKEINKRTTQQNSTRTGTGTGTTTPTGIGRETGTGTGRGTTTRANNGRSTRSTRIGGTGRTRGGQRSSVSSDNGTPGTAYRHPYDQLHDVDIELESATLRP